RLDNPEGHLHRLARGHRPRRLEVDRVCRERLLDGRRRRLAASTATRERERGSKWRKSESEGAARVHGASFGDRYELGGNTEPPPWTRIRSCRGRGIARGSPGPRRPFTNASTGRAERKPAIRCGPSG